MVLPHTSAGRGLCTKYAVWAGWNVHYRHSQIFSIFFNNHFTIGFWTWACLLGFTFWKWIRYLVFNQFNKFNLIWVCHFMCENSFHIFRIQWFFRIRILAMYVMAIRVVKFSNEGYKIRKIYCLRIDISEFYKSIIFILPFTELMSKMKFW